MVTKRKRVSLSDIEKHDPLLHRAIESLVGKCGVRGAYLYGGYIRDYILGSVKPDIDIYVQCDASSVASDLAKELGARCKYIKNLDFHRIIIRQNGSFRWIDLQGNPDLSADRYLMKRDLTINSIAISLSDLLERGCLEIPSDLIDVSSGWRDIQYRLICQTYRESFMEDPVRIVRALRFRQELDSFEIDFVTLNHMRKYLSLLSFEKGDRFCRELLRLFSSRKILDTLSFMQKNGLLSTIDPSLKTIVNLQQAGYHHTDVWSHTMEGIAALNDLLENPSIIPGVDPAHIMESLSRPVMAEFDESPVLRLAMLFHDVGKYEAFSRDESGMIHFKGHAQSSCLKARMFSDRLRLSKPASTMLTSLVQNHMRLLDAYRHRNNEKAVARAVRRISRHMPEIMLLSAADIIATRGESALSENQTENFLGFLGRVYNQQREIAAKKLIDGEDIKRELGIEESPLVGSIMEAVEEARIEGVIRNRNDALEFLKNECK